MRSVVVRGLALLRHERERAGGVDDVLEAAVVGPLLALVADRRAQHATVDVGDDVALGVGRREQAHEAGLEGDPCPGYQVVIGALDAELGVEVAALSSVARCRYAMTQFFLSRQVTVTLALSSGFTPSRLCEPFFSQLWHSTTPSTSPRAPPPASCRRRSREERAKNRGMGNMVFSHNRSKLT